MKVIGVIAEFNPFHKGHEYFLKTARSLSGADRIVCVMSGDFVQRGAPSAYDKFTRTLHALKGGADLVIELPVRYSLGSARDFARGAVSLLEKLGCIDELWFGSESGDIEEITELSRLLSDESGEFKTVLAEALHEGASYPAAYGRAAEEVLGTKAKTILSEPNNILGLEYCSALSYFNSPIVPKTLKREGAGHSDSGSADGFIKIPEMPDVVAGHSDPVRADCFSSAAAVRELIKTDPEKACDCVPPFVAETIKEGYFMEPDDFSVLLKGKLVNANVFSIGRTAGLSNRLSSRMFKYKNDFFTIGEYIAKIKNKNLTGTNISRGIFSYLLNLRETTLYDEAFLRLLGHNGCADLMKLIKKKSTVPLTARPKGDQETAYERDLYASELYDTVRSLKHNIPFVHEFSKKWPVRLP